MGSNKNIIPLTQFNKSYQDKLAHPDNNPNDINDLKTNYKYKRKKIKELFVNVGCVLKGNNVLIVKRSEEEQPDIHHMWELPGGKIKKNERPEETVIREVLEETGYKIEIVDHAPYSYTTYWEYENFFTLTNLLCFECRIKEKQPSLFGYDRKVNERKWENISDLDFFSILPGSREFIWWISEKNSIKIRPEQKYSPASFIRFECIDKKYKKKKFYNISIKIFKKENTHYLIRRSWGRINELSKKFLNKEFYSDLEMRTYLLPIMNKRISHDYIIRDYSKNFPFKNWININQNKIHRKKYNEKLIG